MYILYKREDIHYCNKIRFVRKLHGNESFCLRGITMYKFIELRVGICHYKQKHIHRIITSPVIIHLNLK